MNESERTAFMAKILQKALNEDHLNDLGLKTGQSKRLRKITPYRLLVCLICAMGAGRVESIAALQRFFNQKNGTNVAYKAFYNRLSHPGFLKFMQIAWKHLMSHFALRVLQPVEGSPFHRFKDIVLQDGSSFAVKESLCDILPGRFYAISAAAIEVHGTFSAISDTMIRASISPDTTSERAFLPPVEWMKDKLLLADRGYPSRDYFQRLDAAGGSFIMRLSSAYKPWIFAIYQNGKRLELPYRMPLKQFLREFPQGRHDLEIGWKMATHERYRLVVVQGNKHPILLCTNLDPEVFDADSIEHAYRLRWQIELMFKEYKSYANLHQFDTSNPSIAQGLAWAALCAAALKRFVAHATQLTRGVSTSTRRLAMCAGSFLHSLPNYLLHNTSQLQDFLSEMFNFFALHAARANLRKEREKGRLQAGFSPCLELK